MENAFCCREKTGCGKSSILKMILRDAGMRLPGEKDFCVQGQHELAAGLEISYINQDTSFLRGSLDAYIERESLDGSLFRAILRKLDFERIQFEKPMEEYSEGQKKESPHSLQPSEAGPSLHLG